MSHDIIGRQDLPHAIQITLLYPARTSKDSLVSVIKTWETDGLNQSRFVFEALNAQARKLGLKDEFPGVATKRVDEVLVADGSMAEKYKVPDGYFDAISSKGHAVDFKTAYQGSFEAPALRMYYHSPRCQGRSFIRECMREAFHKGLRRTPEIADFIADRVYREQLNYGRDPLEDGRNIHKVLEGLNLSMADLPFSPRRVPVNPFLRGDRTEGENRGTKRKKFIPEAQGKFWMVVNCDLKPTTTKINEIEHQPKKVFDNLPQARAAVDEMAKKFPGVRFVVVESVYEARATEVEVEEVVTKKVTQTRLNSGEL